MISKIVSFFFLSYGSYNSGVDYSTHRCIGLIIVIMIPTLIYGFIRLIASPAKTSDRLEKESVKIADEGANIVNKAESDFEKIQQKTSHFKIKVCQKCGLANIYTQDKCMRCS